MRRGRNQLISVEVPWEGICQVENFVLGVGASMGGKIIKADRSKQNQRVVELNIMFWKWIIHRQKLPAQ